MVTETRCYKTKEGKLFTTKEQALIEEATEEFNRMFRPGTPCPCNKSELFEWVKFNSQALNLVTASLNVAIPKQLTTDEHETNK